MKAISFPRFFGRWRELIVVIASVLYANSLLLLALRYHLVTRCQVFASIIDGITLKSLESNARSSHAGSTLFTSKNTEYYVQIGKNSCENVSENDDGKKNSPEFHRRSSCLGP